MKKFSGALFLDDRPGPLTLVPSATVAAEDRDDRDLLVACDARIDNRSELGPMLGLTPSASSSLSADAFIAAAFRKWGEDCAQRLIGDFAFAIWDSASRRLFCARDHIGTKPFYYYLHQGRMFLFASDIRSILECPDVTRRVNEGGLRAYLVANFEDPSSTFYEGIKRLRPAHTLTLHAGKLSERRYWSLDPEREQRLLSSDAYSERFDEIFTEAVRCRMDPAGVGALLSGGLDSSSLVCTAARFSHQAPDAPLPTFSAVFDGDPDADERAFIGAVARHAGVDARLVRCDHLSPIAQDLYDEQPEPFWNPHLTMHRALFREAAGAGVRVLLDGFGGDSVCSYGYEGLTEAAFRGRWLRLWHLSRQVASHTPSRPWKIALRHVREALRERRRNREAGPYTAVRAHVADLSSGIYPFILEVMQRTADRAGLEVRYPYFDRRLMEFCVSVPGGEKLRAGWSRAVQRFAMSDRLPAVVTWRTTKGNLGPAFGRSLYRFEGERLSTWVQGPMSELDRFVDARMTRAAHDTFTATKGAEGALRMWNVWTAALWLRSAGMIEGEVMSTSQKVGDQKRSREPAPNPAPGKRYEPPQVTTHGTLAKLTQGIKAGTSDIGGLSATSL